MPIGPTRLYNYNVHNILLREKLIVRKESDNSPKILKSEIFPAFRLASFFLAKTIFSRALQNARGLQIGDETRRETSAKCQISFVLFNFVSFSSFAFLLFAVISCSALFWWSVQFPHSVLHIIFAGKTKSGNFHLAKKRLTLMSMSDLAINMVAYFNIWLTIHSQREDHWNDH